MTSVGAGSRPAPAETDEARPEPEPAVPLEGGLSLRLLPEWELDAALSGQAEALLGACFPGYPARSYFKLPPQLRYLVFAGTKLVAHAGITHRVIRVGELVAKTVGLVDLCVSDRHRSRGLATTLLVEASTYARSCGADFLVLFADRHDLYRRAGWTVVSNRCSWLRIDDHRSLGTTSGPVKGMLVKPLGALAWPVGDVDMLGHVF